MKPNIFEVTFLGCVIVMGLISCNSGTKQNANDKQDSVTPTFKKVQIDSLNEVETYKRQSEVTINENNKKIEDLKRDIAKDEKKMKKGYKRDLDTLDAENRRLERRLREYKDDGKEKWESFKYDFNRDMDSVGKSISRLAEKNMNKE